MSARVRDAVRASSQARLRRRHPSRHDQLGRGVRDDRPDGIEDRAHAGRIGTVEPRPPSTAEQNEVEWSVDVDPESGASAPVVDGHAGVLLEPARERVIGRQIGDVREGSACLCHGDHVRRVAVVREGLGPVGGRRGNEIAPVRRGRERHGPGTQHDQATIPELGDHVAQPRPERPSVLGASMDPGSRRPGVEEPAHVSLGGIQPSRRGGARQRTGVIGRLRVEDGDIDLGHVTLRAKTRNAPPPTTMIGRRSRREVGVGPASIAG